MEYVHSPKQSNHLHFQERYGITFHEKWGLIQSSYCLCVCVPAWSCPAVCDPVDCSPPGSSVHGILQARILEGVAISFSRRSSQPRDRTPVSCIAGGFFTIKTLKLPTCIGAWISFKSVTYSLGTSVQLSWPHSSHPQCGNTAALLADLSEMMPVEFLSWLRVDRVWPGFSFKHDGKTEQAGVVHIHGKDRMGPFAFFRISL